MFSRTKRWHARGRWWILALAIVVTIPAPTMAQQAKDKAALEAVFKDWQYRQSILKSARYVLIGTTEFKDEQLPPGNPIRPRRMTLLLDMARKRYRLEGSEEVLYANGKDDPKEWEFRPRINTSAYDGEALQSLTHRKANRLENDREDDLSIGKGNLGPDAQFDPALWPIFFAHGIVPTVHSTLLVDKLPLTHDPDDFDIAGRQLLRGQNCLLARTEPLAGMTSISDEFWINPSQKSAIYRQVYFSGSAPWSLHDISWKNTAYG
ncbi:MAG: hypothetical protein ACYC3I_25395 [Gemmataceae bacterium]